MSSVLAAVGALRDAFVTAGIPHAFGGAIALGYSAVEPRGTVDVDVNVFVEVEEAPRVFAALPDGVTWSQPDVDRAMRDGQVRVFWGDVALDLFFEYHLFHREAAAHAVTVPFADGDLCILSGDDLAVFKAFFDQGQDWVDIGSMLEAGSLDLDYVAGWLARLLGDGDERIARLRALADEVASDPPGKRPFPRLPG